MSEHLRTVVEPYAVIEVIDERAPGGYGDYDRLRVSMEDVPEILLVAGLRNSTSTSVNDSARYFRFMFSPIADAPHSLSFQVNIIICRHFRLLTGI